VLPSPFPFPKGSRASLPPPSMPAMRVTVWSSLAMGNGNSARQSRGQSPVAAGSSVNRAFAAASTAAVEYGSVAESR
jgi:hypothetical protein